MWLVLSNYFLVAFEKKITWLLFIPRLSPSPSSVMDKNPGEWMDLGITGLIVLKVVDFFGGELVANK